MDPKISKKTQDTLGKIIKKPPLTDKLLGKPPFRFLHDIITEVIRTSGFLKGLYSPEHMESKNVTSREDKISFLQKVISCVSLVTGDSLSARPSKIVAGQEPEKTNELLQAIARCIRKNMSSDEAVSQILSGKPTKSKDKPPSKPPSGTSKKNDGGDDKKERDNDRSKRRDRHENSRDRSADRRKRDRSSDRDRSRERSSNREHRENSATKRDVESREEKNEDKDRRRSKRKERSEKKQKTSKDAETSLTSPGSAASPVTSEKPKEASPAPQQDDPVETSEPGPREATEGAESNTPTGMGRTQRPASAKGQRRRPNPGSAKSQQGDDSVDAPTNDSPAPKKLIRPPSARPSAPRVKQRTADNDESERVNSGGQDRSVPIFVDRDMDESLSDDDNQFVVTEEAEQENDNGSTTLLNSNRSPTNLGNDDDDDDDHGGLVRKILETKKELEETAAAGHGIKKHTDIQRSNVISAQQRKERELVVKEIEQLRMSVQKLCQSTTPLAKIIDYIQEDMDSMQNELQAWKKENKLHAVRIKEEDSITAECIEPLKTELEGLDESIAQYRNQMSATKANIIRNEEKIQKMIIAVAGRS